MKKLWTSVFAVIAIAMLCNPAQATISLLDKDNYKLTVSGFVEFDTYVDSTRSFNEIIGNTAIARPDTQSGSNGRTHMSVRNSRLGIGLEAPEYHAWKSRGYLEFDLLGYDPAPGTPTGAVNTEQSFMSNPTMRIRHAYVQADSEGWQFLAGQTWNTFGWQPYYFIPIIEPSPIAGQLYSRNTQARAQKNVDFGQTTAQAALAVARPVQRDSGLPAFEGGLRLAFNGRKSGFTGGATGPQKAQPASIAVSGAFRDITLPVVGGDVAEQRHYPAGAFAINGLLPILAATDDKDVSNSLSLVGEFTMGRGYGDQFSGYTGGIASPLSTAAAGTRTNALNAARSLNLDSGIGDYDLNSEFHLVNLRSFNTHIQYHLPNGCQTWISAGYGELHSSNIGDVSTSAPGLAPRGSAGGFLYQHNAIYFANIAHDFTSHIRLGLEYNHTRTVYSDETRAHNNRYMVAAFFLF